MRRLLHFRYAILLEFSRPVVRHSFVLRCLPPDLPWQRILDVTLALDPTVPVALQRDSFGNLIQAGCIEAPHTNFRYRVQGTALRDDSRRSAGPCHPVFRQPSAYTVPSPEMLCWLDGLQLPAQPRPRAWALAQAVHDRLSYTPGATGVATTAAQAFAAGQGVCQDFAHVYLALARRLGLPARYVNGLPEGEGASHAWCEVWLDQGWTGIDPTRLQWTDEGYLRFGVGRDFGDCPIERGIFVGNADQTQTVHMRVEAEQEPCKTI